MNLETTSIREAALHFFDAGEDSNNIDNIIDNIVCHHNINMSGDKHQILCNATPTSHKPLNYDALYPFFINTTDNVIKWTFDATAQFARTPMSGLQL